MLSAYQTCMADMHIICSTGCSSVPRSEVQRLSVVTTDHGIYACGKHAMRGTMGHMVCLPNRLLQIVSEHQSEARNCIQYCVCTSQTVQHCCTQSGTPSAEHSHCAGAAVRLPLTVSLVRDHVQRTCVTVFSNRGETSNEHPTMVSAAPAVWPDASADAGCSQTCR